MTDIDREFTCINCGRQIQSLYKKYSETVLKLRECVSLFYSNLCVHSYISLYVLEQLLSSFG